jgi:hypothetical protein
MCSNNFNSQRQATLNDAGAVENDGRAMRMRSKSCAITQADSRETDLQLCSELRTK